MPLVKKETIRLIDSKKRDQKQDKRKDPKKEIKNSRKKQLAKITKFCTTMVMVSVTFFVQKSNLKAEKNKEIFSFYSSEYTFVKDASYKIIDDAEDVNKDLEYRLVYCYSPGITNRKAMLTQLHLKFIDDTAKLRNEANKYLVTDEHKKLSPITTPLKQSLQLYEKNRPLFEQCSPTADKIFSPSGEIEDNRRMSQKAIRNQLKEANEIRRDTLNQ